jgi:hypothetical protein
VRGRRTEKGERKADREGSEERRQRRLRGKKTEKDEREEDREG